MSSPVILVLGAGSNVGRGVAQAFLSRGYKVALASRSAKETESTADQVYITSDLSKPESVAATFSKVKSLLGIPSVVVYNGKSQDSLYGRLYTDPLPAAASTSYASNDPLSVDLTDFVQDLNINITSPFVAAQQAVLGFSQLPASASRTFIYTGNILNTTPMAPLMNNGLGKSAAAHMIQSAALAYEKQGFTFYYGDERKADGSAAFKIDGDAHGRLYLDLAEKKSQGPWQQTFVRGEGYKAFPL